MGVSSCNGPPVVDTGAPTTNENTADTLPPRLLAALIVIGNVPDTFSGPVINKPLKVNGAGKPLAVKVSGSLLGSLNVLVGTRNVNVVPTVPVCEGIGLTTVGVGTGADEGVTVTLATAALLRQLLSVQMAEIVITPAVPVGTTMLPSRLTPIVPKYEIYPPVQPVGTMTTGVPPCATVADEGLSVGGLVGGTIVTATGVARPLVPLLPVQVADSV